MKKERIHIPFLDGIRGLTAFYVLLFHVIVNGNQELSTNKLFLNLFRFGREAVVIFIVLSGFLLTLPLARSDSPNLYGGLKNFFHRRGKRILPGYYAALLLLPIYFVLVELLKYFSGEGFDWIRIQTMFLNRDMLSHIFLLHNLSIDWVYSFNPVLWSLATEWWIYAVFAIILIPIWKKFGVISAIVISFILGLIPIYLRTEGLPTVYANPHLLGAFGLGMVCAILIFNDRFTNNFQFWRKILFPSAFLFFIIFCTLSVYQPQIRLVWKTIWITDYLTAFFFSTIMLVLLSKANSSDEIQNNSLIIKLLSLRPLVLLGNFSYSIYLTHLVMWGIIGTTLNLEPIKNKLQLSTEPMIFRVFIGIPILVLFAFGFYLLFEKPFLSRKI